MNARVDFYLQGATVSSTPYGTKVNPNGGTLDVLVYDVGRIVGGQSPDQVLVGADGPALSVVTVVSPTRLTLKNNGALAVYVYSGTRLLVATRRPLVSAGLFGPETAESHVFTDADGRAVGYLDEVLFDYVVKPGGRPALMVDSPTFTTKSGSPSNTLTWNHSVGGVDRLVVVGVSWRSQGAESLTGVKYGGIDMILHASANYVAVYYLVNPPPGPQSIVATWSGSGHKGAIGGAMSWRGVDQVSPLGASGTNQGSSTTPSVSLSGVGALGSLFDVLGINGATSTPSATPSAGQTQRWNLPNGAVGNQDLTRGAASTRLDGSVTPTMGWTLSGLRAWGIVAGEVKAGSYLAVDAAGSALVPSLRALNARDFQSLADAIAALPATGGEVFLPAGEYLVAVSLLIDKPNVILRGEGNSTLIRAVSSNPNLDLLTVVADGIKLVDLQIGKYDLGGGTTLTTHRALAIVPSGPIRRATLVNVRIEGGEQAGLHFHDVDCLQAMGCCFASYLGAGLFASSFEGDVQLTACQFQGNGAGAAQVFGASKGTARFAGCAFDDNHGGLGAQEANAIMGSDLDVLNVEGCRFSPDFAGVGAERAESARTKS